MDQRFEQCLNEGKVVRISVQSDLIQKEINAAKLDLESAKVSLSSNNFKWSIVQAYYSMFHTSKALVLSKGYREKSHICLSFALKALFTDTNILQIKHFERFRDCMDLREDADYGLIYSNDSAKTAFDWANEFFDVAIVHLQKSNLI